MRKTILWGCFYLALVTYNSAAMLAYFQAEFPTLAEEGYRKDLGAAIGMSLIPVIPWVLTPFVTGFYEHGFCLTRPQCEQRVKESKR